MVSACIRRRSMNCANWRNWFFCAAFCSSTRTMCACSSWMLNRWPLGKCVNPFSSVCLISLRYFCCGTRWSVVTHELLGCTCTGVLYFSFGFRFCWRLLHWVFVTCMHQICVAFLAALGLCGYTQRWWKWCSAQNSCAYGRTQSWFGAKGCFLFFFHIHSKSWFGAWSLFIYSFIHSSGTVKSFQRWLKKTPQPAQLIACICLLLEHLVLHEIKMQCWTTLA
jgi:hypothetical protein